LNLRRDSQPVRVINDVAMIELTSSFMKSNIGGSPLDGQTLF
jgi:hypothetical protein